MDWLIAFVFTQCVEVPCYRYWGRVRLDEAFAASSLTHPVVWWIIPQLLAPILTDSAGTGVGDGLLVVSCEAYAIVVEALYLRTLGAKRPWIMALVANLASASLGLASRSVWGVP